MPRERQFEDVDLREVARHLQASCESQEWKP
jgi:hypothetical protein